MDTLTETPFSTIALKQIQCGVYVKSMCFWSDSVFVGFNLFLINLLIELVFRVFVILPGSYIYLFHLPFSNAVYSYGNDCSLTHTPSMHKHTHLRAHVTFSISVSVFIPLIILSGPLIMCWEAACSVHSFSACQKIEGRLIRLQWGCIWHHHNLWFLGYEPEMRLVSG